MTSAQKVTLIVLAGALAAVIPGGILIYSKYQDQQTAAKKAREIESSKAPNGRVVQKSRSKKLVETDLKISALGEDLLWVGSFERESEQEPVVTGMELKLATLWTESANPLARSLEGFWTRIPRDLDTISSADAKALLGVTRVDGTPILLEHAEVKFSRGPAGAQVKIRYQGEQGELELDADRVERTGAVHLTATNDGKTAIFRTWLPKGWGLRFKKIDVVGNQRIILDKPEIINEQGEVVFSAQRFEAADSENLTGLVTAGIPGDQLGSRKDFTSLVINPRIVLPKATRLPLFASLNSPSGGAPIEVEAESMEWSNRAIELAGVTMKGPGGLKIRSVRVKWEPGANAGKVAMTQFQASIPSLASSVEGDELALATDQFGISTFALSKGLVKVKPDPLTLMSLTVKAKGLMTSLKGLVSPRHRDAAAAQVTGEGGEFSLAPVLKALEQTQVRLRESTLVLAAGPMEMSFGDVELDIDWKFASELKVRFQAGLVDGVDSGSPLLAELDVDAKGSPSGFRIKAGGSRLSELIRRVVPGGFLKSGNLDLDLSWAAAERESRISGSFTGTDLVFEVSKIATWPWNVPLVTGVFDGLIADGGEQIRLNLSRLELGKVWWRGFVELGRLSGVPTIRLSVDFPSQDCNQLFRAIPKDLVPHLKGAMFQGTISYRLEFFVDMSDIRESIKFDLTGDLEKCQVLSLGSTIDVSQLLRNDYLHRVVVGGEDLGIDVGPGTSQFIRIARIPKYVQAAAWGTEDLAFWEHHGFKLGLIRRAIILLLERGRFAYGGSTVSQQLVKNLFFYRDKTLTRKLEEAIVTWEMERQLPKERILELYLNCIEFGPGIWGIGPAARIYFGKNPEDLTPLEGAFIMGLKPDPPYGYLQYRRGKVNERWKQKLKEIMDRLHFEMGAISRAQYDAESTFEPVFRVPGADSQEPVPELPPEGIIEPAAEDGGADNVQEL